MSITDFKTVTSGENEEESPSNTNGFVKNLIPNTNHPIFNTNLKTTLFYSLTNFWDGYVMYKCLPFNKNQPLLSNMYRTWLVTSMVLGGTQHFLDLIAFKGIPTSKEENNNLPSILDKLFCLINPKHPGRKQKTTNKYAPWIVYLFDMTVIIPTLIGTYELAGEVSKKYFDPKSPTVLTKKNAVLSTTLLWGLLSQYLIIYNGSYKKYSINWHKTHMTWHLTKHLGLMAWFYCVLDHVY